MKYLQVVGDRKWKDVVMVFNFPSTITSASFVVRKHYMTLLFDFEQVYYFHKRAPSHPLPGTLKDDLKIPFFFSICILYGESLIKYVIEQIMGASTMIRQTGTKVSIC